MKNSTVFDCKIIEFNKQSNNITIENKMDIPFDVKRIYYLYDVKNSSIRGEHAHKDLFQVIFGLNQGLKIEIDDGQNKKIFNLLDKRQMKSSVKVKSCDHVIHNNRSFKMLKKNAKNLLKRYE